MLNYQRVSLFIHPSYRYDTILPRTQAIPGLVCLSAMGINVTMAHLWISMAGNVDNHCSEPLTVYPIISNYISIMLGECWLTYKMYKAQYSFVIPIQLPLFDREIHYQ